MLELANVPHDVTPDAVQVENGIAHDLAGSMIGDIAAAITVMKFDALLAEQVFGGAQILGFAVTTQGNDVGVFAEKQEIGHRADFSRGNQALLERRSSAVIQPSQLDHSAALHWRQLFIRAASAALMLSEMCPRRAISPTNNGSLSPGQRQRHLPSLPTPWDEHAP